MPVHAPTVFEKSVAVTNSINAAGDLLAAFFSPGTHRASAAVLADALKELSRLRLVDINLSGNQQNPVVNTIQGAAESFENELMTAGDAKRAVKKALNDYKADCLNVIKDSTDVPKNDPSTSVEDPSELIARFMKHERVMMAKCATQGVFMGTAPVLPIVSFDQSKLNGAGVSFVDMLGYTVLLDQPVFGVSMDYVEKQLKAEGTDVAALSAKKKQEAIDEYLEEALSLYVQRHRGTAQLGPVCYYRGCAFFWMLTSPQMNVLSRCAFGGHLAVKQWSFAFQKETRPVIKSLRG